MDFIATPLTAPFASGSIINPFIGNRNNAIDNDDSTFAFIDPEVIPGVFTLAAGSAIDYNFDGPLATSGQNFKEIFIEKIVFKTDETTGGTLTINEADPITGGYNIAGGSNAEFEASWTKTYPTFPHFSTVNVNQTFKSIRRITLFLETLGQTSQESKLYSVRIHGKYVLNPDVEFNDSVLTTKAWNSSRYNGKQLSAQKINQISESDIGNNNKTPIIRNYTRNIYIGNEVVGMAETSPEDPSLVQFPDFSYIQINSYITVNEDGTITKISLDPQENNTSQKKSFYRPFTYDLTEGSFCNFILGDPTIKNNLKTKYPIYFNGGQLKKLLTLQTRMDPTFNGPEELVSDGDFIFTNLSAVGCNPRANGAALYKNRVDIPDDEYNTQFGGGPGVLPGATNGWTSSLGLELNQTTPPTLVQENEGALYIGGQKGIRTQYRGVDDTEASAAINVMIPKLDNEDIISKFFTEQFVHDRSTVAATGGIRQFGAGARIKTLYDWGRSFISYKNNSDYTGDKRFFITVAGPHDNSYFPTGSNPIGNPGNPTPLYSFIADNNHTGSVVQAGSTIDSNAKLFNLATLEVSAVNHLKYSGSLTYSSFEMVEFRFNPNISTLNISGHTFGDKVPQSGSIDVSTTPVQSVRNIISTENDALTYGNGVVPNLRSGSFMFSITDDDVPSLLVPLKKERDLSNGKGDKPFIVISDNLHPYVKDNLLLYLSKAGIDIGGSATDSIEESTQKKYKLTSPEEQLSRRDRRRARREDRRERREERRNERRENRSDRRAERQENREERRSEREEKRNQRRQNRDENKDNRREERQNRRENRRNRRRRR